MRLDLHAAVGQQLAERLAADPEAIFQVAHHLLLAASRHAPAAAVQRASEAAERAQRHAAYEVAADYYWRALTVLDLHVGDSAAGDGAAAAAHRRDELIPTDVGVPVVAAATVRSVGRNAM